MILNLLLAEVSANVLVKQEAATTKQEGQTEEEEEENKAEKPAK